MAATWVRTHQDIVEGGAGLLAGTAVLAVSLLQWGATDDGWTRGVTLGVAVGIIVAYSVRRDRRMRESRDRAATDLRLQLARDLHDAVASQVAIIGIQAAAASRVLDAQPARVADALATIEVAARTANLDLRGMLTALRTEPGSRPATSGLADLPALIETFRRAGLVVRVVGLETVPMIEPAVDAAAYRIVQESLGNALAHAGRVPATVTFTHADGTVRIRVVNAAGTPTDRYLGTGLGLVGMRERAERLGGTLRASGAPDGSFVVEGTIPVAHP
jgi:signal transduction histidine kinase